MGVCAFDRCRFSMSSTLSTVQNVPVRPQPALQCTKTGRCPCGSASSLLKAVVLVICLIFSHCSINCKRCDGCEVVPKSGQYGYCNCVTSRNGWNGKAEWERPKCLTMIQGFSEVLSVFWFELLGSPVDGLGLLTRDKSGWSIDTVLWKKLLTWKCP